jgi:hypothetical protein
LPVIAKHIWFSAQSDVRFLVIYQMSAALGRELSGPEFHGDVVVLVLHVLWMTLQLFAILAVVFLVNAALFVTFFTYVPTLSIFQENYPSLSRALGFLLDALLLWLGFWHADLLLGMTAALILVIIGLTEFNRRRIASLT